MKDGDAAVLLSGESAVGQMDDRPIGHCWLRPFGRSNKHRKRENEADQPHWVWVGGIQAKLGYGFGRPAKSDRRANRPWTIPKSRA
jgi:hypothetical protein